VSNKLNLAQAVKGVFNFYAKATDCEEVITRRSVVFSAQETAAASTIPETVAWTAPVNCNVRAVSITAGSTVASNGTNYATITVGVRSAGGAVTNMATLTTSTTALTSFVPVVTNLSPLQAMVGNTDVVTVVCAKAGGGNAPTTNGFNVTVFYEET
jgi:hypothetical protein